MHSADGWWDAIDPQLLKRLDRLLCTGRLIPAVILLRQEGGQHPSPGLYEAQDLLLERRTVLDRQGLLEPDPPPPTTAQQAIEQGRAVARHVGVPFHFASPEKPNDDLPRWWDAQPR